MKGGLGQGLWLDLNPRTDSHYYTGTVEEAVQRALGTVVQPGMVVYDIGANIGFFTLVMCRLVGKSGRVFAFEPDPEIFGELEKNVSRNGNTNITIIQTAVWSTTGAVEFARADPRQSPNRGTGHVRTTTSEDFVVSESITLDEFAKNVVPPQVIKCDAEGGEAEIFAGARNLLEEHRPVVICEVHSAAQSAALEGIFSDADYLLHSVDQNHILALAKGS